MDRSNDSAQESRVPQTLTPASDESPHALVSEPLIQDLSGAADRSHPDKNRVLFISDTKEFAKPLPGIHTCHMDQARSRLAADRFDVVLVKLSPEKAELGIHLAKWIQIHHPKTPVLLMVHSTSAEIAIQALKAGMSYLVPDSITDTDLLEVLTRVSQDQADRLSALTHGIAENDTEFKTILGESAQMQRVYSLIDRLAKADVSVLITGESGTGKELVARALHMKSHRKNAPFVAVNCAAIPENLLESELFGYERGAFTGARSAKPGRFVQADGGTFFLDEVTELPRSLQPKLLRSLEERSVQPVGGKNEIRFDVRLISATNTDLESAIADGHFRKDLYYRLNVVHIELPPLRTRGGDVLILADAFLHRFARRMKKDVRGISSGAADRLLAYPWPGNVRELRNCIERAIVLASHKEIVVDDLPERIQIWRNRPVLVAATGPDDLVSMKEVERRYIQRVLDAVNGNRTVAAKILGFDRKTLYRKLTRYQLNGTEEA